jgi:hypothetical protein
MLPPDVDSSAILDDLCKGAGGWSTLKHVCAALTKWPSTQANEVDDADELDRDAENEQDAPVDGDASGDDAAVESPAARRRRAAARKAREQRQAKQKLTLSLARAELDRLLLANEQQTLALCYVQGAVQRQQRREQLALTRARLLLLSGSVDLAFGLDMPMEAVQVPAPYKDDEPRTVPGLQYTRERVLRWLEQVCDLPVPRNRTVEFERQVCGVAAVSAWWLQSQVLHTDRIVEEQHCKSQEQLRGGRARRVHQMLDRFYRGNLSREEVCKYAQEWLDAPHHALLVDDRVFEALDALRGVLEKPIERHLVQILREQGKGSFEAYEDILAELFDVKPGHAVLKQLKCLADGSWPSRGIRLATVNGCPHCGADLTAERRSDHYRELTGELNWQLRRHGFAKCPRGNHLLIVEVTDPHEPA